MSEIMDPKECESCKICEGLMEKADPHIHRLTNSINETDMVAEFERRIRTQISEKVNLYNCEEMIAFNFVIITFMKTLVRAAEAHFQNIIVDLHDTPKHGVH